RTIVEGDTLSLSIDVSDPDGDDITLSLGAGAPAGALLNSQNRSLTWVTGEAHGPSTNNITIIARDSGIPQLSASQSFTVIVLESNSPPTLDEIADKTITEGQLLTFAVAASDPDLPPQALTFSLVGAPSGATIHPTTGIFS